MRDKINNGTQVIFKTGKGTYKGLWIDNVLKMEHDGTGQSNAVSRALVVYADALYIVEFENIKLDIDRGGY